MKGCWEEKNQLVHFEGWLEDQKKPLPNEMRAIYAKIKTPTFI